MAHRYPPDQARLRAPGSRLQGTTYPPTQTSFRRRNPQRHDHSRSTRPSIWSRIGYQSSFALCLLILAALLLLQAYGIGYQAFFMGPVGRSNIVILAAAYAAVIFICLGFAWSRLLTITRLLRAMPKPYMPTKYLDLEKVVADHIMSEYSRTAVIAHISQATTGKQEGWGRPGTKWADKHFRTEMLATLPDMHHLLLSSHPRPPRSSSSPLSLEPISTAAAETDDKALILFVNSYIKLIEQARYARREPSEADAQAVEKVVDVVRRTMEVRRAKERAERDAGPWGRERRKTGGEG